MNNKPKLYEFRQLRSFLKKEGYPSLEIDKQGFITIGGIDFNAKYKAGEISFDEDGVYIHINNIKYKGYMFMQNYNVMFDGTKKFPKFHLIKCGVIQNFISRGDFNQKYIFAISRTNTVVDSKSGYRYSKTKLNICENCQRKLKSTIPSKEYNSEDFFEEQKEKFEPKKIKTDFNGYIFGWKNISKNFRNRKGFVCQNCKISPKENKHQMYWDTHHIERDKLKNDDKDLQCLCKLCHKHVDEIHEKEMKNSTMVKQFIEIYREDLILKGNPYIHLYR